ncbi:MAG: MATE family efflux transporter [Eubacteriales bacterium]
MTAAQPKNFKISHDRAFYKSFALLTLPIIAQNIITHAVTLADNIMVSGLGEVALDGVYVTNLVTMFVTQLIAGISPAMIILATQYWGKKDVKSMKNVISIGMRISLIGAAVIGAALLIFPQAILGLFTDDAAVVSAAVGYARIIACTYVFYAVSNILIAAMRCAEVVRIGMVVSAAALAVNVSLNWVFIYGHFGVPAMGAPGAAISTLISRIIEASIMVFYVFFRDKKLRIRISELLCRVERVLLRDFVRYGFPVILGSATWGINLLVQGAIIGHLDVNSISAYSIAGTVFSILTVAAYGSATASSIVIAKTVGGGDIEKVKTYARTLQLIFLCVGIFTGALIFFTRPLVLMIYGSMEAKTLEYANQFLIVLAAMSVGTSYQMATLTGIVRAGGATSFVLINDLIFVWCIVIPSAALAAFVFNAPSWVVVLCLKCDQILKCAVAVVEVNRFTWIKKLTR